MDARSCLATAMLFACGCALAAQNAGTTGTWKIVPSPNGGSQALGNNLLATVAISSKDAWAVGTEPNPVAFETATSPLAEHWDGTQWSIVQTPVISAPTSQFNSISAADYNDVWAAGYSDNPSCFCGLTIVEQWNGSAWTRLATPNPGIANYLNGIAAVSAADVWAVGYQWPSEATTVPLLMHYDGSSWSTFDESQLKYANLNSVFAVAANDVWAVGTFNNTEGLTLHWNGTSWRQVPFPSPPGGSTVLASVSGAAADDLWAVGDFQYVNNSGGINDSAVGYHWNGSSWTAVPVGLGGYSYLNTVMARATSDVWAVGGGMVGISFEYRYVTLHWDGAIWSSVANPNKGILYGVSASSSSDAWAVGMGFDKVGTYVLHYTVP